MLKTLGLVSQRQDANTHWYALEPEAIANLAKRILSREQIAGLARNGAARGLAKAVLSTFVGPDGAIKSIPASRKKRGRCWRGWCGSSRTAAAIRKAEINARLLEHHWDSATLRREFIGYRMMAREAGVYWRVPESDWLSETPASRPDLIAPVADDPFKPWLDRWRLTPDGEAFATRFGSRLMPVIADGAPAMLKIAGGEEERNGAALMAWYAGEGASAGPGARRPGCFCSNEP